MATQSRKQYKKMTEAWFRQIKKDIPSHPRLSKSVAKLAKLYEVSDTTMAKVVKARNWVHYLEITKAFYDKRFGTKPVEGVAPKGTVPLFPKDPADKAEQVHADAVDQKPKSVAAIAAAVAHSVVEREIANRVNSAAIVINWAPGVTITKTITNGVTFMEFKPQKSYWLIKALAVTMVATGAVLLILPFLGR